ncbi:hypothetical protein AU378_12155 [Chryseobacterium kwangjuense]|uniref:Uncharacterized protein n=1 Tax=Chryseobacterium kwangjuense TaxID=267125 RepID=A0A135WE55_9FLAO|nr:hypothetical protein AU378_12155 [Chryseobacterium kwangjuense]
MYMIIIVKNYSCRDGFLWLIKAKKAKKADFRDCKSADKFIGLLSFLCLFAFPFSQLYSALSLPLILV